MLTVEIAGAQTPFETVQAKTLTPGASELMGDAAKVLLAIVAVPLNKFHTPLPTVGVEAFRVAVVAQSV
jgi:hypothetical protein